LGQDVEHAVACARHGELGLREQEVDRVEAGLQREIVAVDAVASRGEHRVIVRASDVEPQVARAPVDHTSVAIVDEPPAGAGFERVVAEPHIAVAVRVVAAADVDVDRHR
jgi:hypothetical protein